MEVTGTCLFFFCFVGRFSCHDSSKWLSVVGWLRCSLSFFSQNYSSLSSNACVKSFIYFFDILFSFWTWVDKLSLRASSSWICPFDVVGNSSCKFSFNCSFPSAPSKVAYSLLDRGTSKSSLKSFICIARAEVFIIWVFNDLNI